VIALSSTTTQRFSKVEAITGFERVNKYDSWDGDTGEQIFHAREQDQGWFLRNYLSYLRNFSMPFMNANNQEIFRLDKSRSCVNNAFVCFGMCGCCCGCWAKCCGCCGFDTKLTNLAVTFQGEEQFYVGQEGMGCCQKPNYSITDKRSGQVIYTITHPSCVTWACCCGDVVYDILDHGGAQVGSITKYWAGGKTGCNALWIESFNASTFVIDFPEGATSRQKVALIGAQLLIDFAYYQQKGDS